MKSAIAKFVELPEMLKASITAVVVLGVSFVFANLILLVPFLAFLEQFKVPVGLAIAMALIELIQKSVPDAYANVAIAAVQLVLAILAVLGVGQTLTAAGKLPAFIGF